MLIQRPILDRLSAAPIACQLRLVGPFSEWRLAEMRGITIHPIKQSAEITSGSAGAVNIEAEYRRIVGQPLQISHTVCALLIWPTNFQIAAKIAQIEEIMPIRFRDSTYWIVHK